MERKEKGGEKRDREREREREENMNVKERLGLPLCQELDCVHLVERSWRVDG